jgi:hypothetical protein
VDANPIVDALMLSTETLKENAMAAKNKVTVSVDRPTLRPTPAERRAALTAAIAGQQQTLKREAAERRAKRADDDGKGQPLTGEPDS